jgi:hypothetical protein
MPEEGAQPYEVEVTTRSVDGTEHTAHGEVRSSDPPELVGRRMLESLQSQRGKDYVRNVDPDA